MNLTLSFAVLICASTTGVEVEQCPIDYYGNWNGVYYFLWEECGGTESGFDASSRMHQLGCNGDTCPDPLVSMPEVRLIGDVEVVVRKFVPPIKPTGKSFEPSDNVTVVRNVVKRIDFGDGVIKTLRFIRLKITSNKIPPDRRKIWVAQFEKPQDGAIWGRAASVQNDNWSTLKIMGPSGAEKRRCFFLPYGGDETP